MFANGFVNGFDNILLRTFYGRIRIGFTSTNFCFGNTIYDPMSIRGIHRSAMKKKQAKKEEFSRSQMCFDAHRKIVHAKCLCGQSGNVSQLFKQIVFHSFD